MELARLCSLGRVPASRPPFVAPGAGPGREGSEWLDEDGEWAPVPGSASRASPGAAEVGKEGARRLHPMGTPIPWAPPARLCWAQASLCGCTHALSTAPPSEREHYSSESPGRVPTLPCCLALLQDGLYSREQSPGLPGLEVWWARQTASQDRSKWDATGCGAGKMQGPRKISGGILARARGGELASGSSPCCVCLTGTLILPATRPHAQAGDCHTLSLQGASPARPCPQEARRDSAVDDVEP